MKNSLPRSKPWLILRGLQPTRYEPPRTAQRLCRKSKRRKLNEAALQTNAVNPIGLMPAPVPRHFNGGRCVEHLAVRANLSAILVKGDGTYANSKNTWCDEDWIYENHVKPSLEIAQKYGVGFMVNEFGVASVKVNWPIETVVAFHETYLKMLEKYDLSWCYLEIANVWPKHLVILSGKSQWAGATTQTVTYTFDDGSTETIRICKELVDLFRKYTLK